MASAVPPLETAVFLKPGDGLAWARVGVTAATLGDGERLDEARREVGARDARLVASLIVVASPESTRVADLRRVAWPG